MDAGLMGSGAQSDVVPVQARPAHGAGWMVRSAEARDIEVIAEPRATVMRADLERLGR